MRRTCHGAVNSRPDMLGVAVAVLDAVDSLEGIGTNRNAAEPRSGPPGGETGRRLIRLALRARARAGRRCARERMVVAGRSGPDRHGRPDASRVVGIPLMRRAGVPRPPPTRTWIGRDAREYAYAPQRAEMPLERRFNRITKGSVAGRGKHPLHLLPVHLTQLF